VGVSRLTTLRYYDCSMTMTKALLLLLLLVVVEIQFHR